MISEAIKVRLTRRERAVLEARLRAGSTEQRQLLRTRIVLEAAEGLGTREIARGLDTTPTTVSLWRGRFARERLDGLQDLPRSGAPPVCPDGTKRQPITGPIPPLELPIVCHPARHSMPHRRRPHVLAGSVGKVSSHRCKTRNSRRAW